MSGLLCFIAELCTTLWKWLEWMKCPVFLLYRHSLTCAVVMLWKVWCKSNFVHVRIEYAYGQLYVYIQESPVEDEVPTHWNLISHSMTFPVHVLSSSSILPPPSSHCACPPTRKNIWCIFQKCYCFNFFTFCKILKLEIVLVLECLHI